MATKPPTRKLADYFRVIKHSFLEHSPHIVRRLSHPPGIFLHFGGSPSLPRWHWSWWIWDNLMYSDVNPGWKWTSPVLLIIRGEPLTKCDTIIFFSGEVSSFLIHQGPLSHTQSTQGWHVSTWKYQHPPFCTICPFQSLRLTQNISKNLHSDPSSWIKHETLQGKKNALIVLVIFRLFTIRSSRHPRHHPISFQEKFPVMWLWLLIPVTGTARTDHPLLNHQFVKIRHTSQHITSSLHPCPKFTAESPHVHSCAI